MAKLAARKNTQTLSAVGTNHVHVVTNELTKNLQTHTFSTGKGSSVTITQDKILEATVKYGLNVDNNSFM